MNLELKQLYQEVILDHNKNPRNYGELEGYDLVGVGKNPLCGDQYNVYIKVSDNIITEVKFDGSGCAISKASASLMTTLVKGKTTQQADKLFEDFQKVITTKIEDEVDTEQFGKLIVLAGVREFPARVKCAGLAWHTLHSAIQKGQAAKEIPVSTE
ncbi:MAG: Fe-S cluster assembly sulfur transfer protein SufU [Candidatus Kapaibacteriota bacterium]|jgi:nitrogen fixation NifU-like protein